MHFTRPERSWLTSSWLETSPGTNLIAHCWWRLCGKKKERETERDQRVHKWDREIKGLKADRPADPLAWRRHGGRWEHQQGSWQTLNLQAADADEDPVSWEGNVQDHVKAFRNRGRQFEAGRMTICDDLMEERNKAVELNTSWVLLVWTWAIWKEPENHKAFLYTRLTQPRLLS